MMTMQTVVYDAHAFLNQVILEQGFEDQEDQELFDRVNQFTIRQAISVLRILTLRATNAIPISNDEFKVIILTQPSDDDTSVLLSNTSSIYH